MIDYAKELPPNPYAGHKDTRIVYGAESLDVAIKTAPKPLPKGVIPEIGAALTSELPGEQ